MYRRDMTTLRFYFDFISHNAYIAWTQIYPLAERYGRTVEPIPVLFAGLLNANGQKGPAEIPAKAWWMAKDLLRKAARLNVPMRPPASHPFNPLVALRAALVPNDPVQRKHLIDALFRATWVDGKDVSKPDIVAAIGTSVGIDGAALLAAIQSDHIKQRLRSETDAAVEQLVFGVPTMIVDDELFWGYDDFGHLELYLAGKDPLDRSVLDEWMNVRPSASRQRKE
jgi:2-hydroxychromene-2-carboxylate isomerase